MKRSSFLALVALFVAATGVIIALAAYFKKKGDYLFDDDEDFLFDDSDGLEYYTSELNEDDEDNDNNKDESPVVDESDVSGQ